MERNLLFKLVIPVLGVFAIGASAVAQPPDGRGASHSFLVEIDAMTPGNFRNVEGLDSETEVIEVRSGGDDEVIRKVPGRTSYANIVLQAAPDNPVLDEFWLWRQQVVAGELDRRNGSIVMLDRQGNEVVRYNFERGWPSKWKGPGPVGKGTEVSMEEIVLAVERIERQ